MGYYTRYELETVESKDLGKSILKEMAAHIAKKTVIAPSPLIMASDDLVTAKPPSVAPAANPSCTQELFKLSIILAIVGSISDMFTLCVKPKVQAAVAHNKISRMESDSQPTLNDKRAKAIP